MEMDRQYGTDGMLLMREDQCMWELWISSSTWWLSALASTAQQTADIGYLDLLS